MDAEVFGRYVCYTLRIILLKGSRWTSFLFPYYTIITIFVAAAVICIYYCNVVEFSLAAQQPDTYLDCDT